MKTKDKNKMIKCIKIETSAFKKRMEIGDFCNKCGNEIKEGEDYFQLLNEAYIDHEDIEIICCNYSNEKENYERERIIDKIKEWDISGDMSQDIINFIKGDK